MMLLDLTTIPADHGVDSSILLTIPLLSILFSASRILSQRWQEN